MNKGTHTFKCSYEIFIQAFYFITVYNQAFIYLFSHLFNLFSIMSVSKYFLLAHKKIYISETKPRLRGKSERGWILIFKNRNSPTLDCPSLWVSSSGQVWRRCLRGTRWLNQCRGAVSQAGWIRAGGTRLSGSLFLQEEEALDRGSAGTLLSWMRFNSHLFWQISTKWVFNPNPKQLQLFFW